MKSLDEVAAKGVRAKGPSALLRHTNSRSTHPHTHHSFAGRYPFSTPMSCSFLVHPCL